MEHLSVNLWLMLPVLLLQPPELSGNQNAIAEDIAKKEIDLKLGKDAPKPSQEAKNVAADVAKAEIQIDQGKQKSTRNWFGLGKGPSKVRILRSIPKKEIWLNLTSFEPQWASLILAID